MAASDPDLKYRWEHRLLLCGAMFGIAQTLSLLFFVVVIGPAMPRPGSAPERYAEFYISHGGELQAANYLLSLPAPLFLLFIGGLYSAIRRTGSATIPLGTTALAAGSAMILLWPALPSVLSTVTVSAAFAHGDPALIRALDEMCPALLSLSGFPRCVFLLAVSALVYEHRIAPRWIARTGFVLGAAIAAGTPLMMQPRLIPVALAGVVGSLLWITVLSHSLAARARLAGTIYTTNLTQASRAW